MREKEGEEKRGTSRAAGRSAGTERTEPAQPGPLPTGPPRADLFLLAGMTYRLPGRIMKKVDHFARRLIRAGQRGRA